MSALDNKDPIIDELITFIEKWRKELKDQFTKEDDKDQFTK